MWRGQTVAILASGPSMSQAVADRVGEAKVCVVAVNTTVKLAPWADMLYAADDFWIVKYEKLAAGFAGLKVTCSDDNHHGWLALRNTGKVGFDHDVGCVRTGGNSGYQAIHLALHAHAHRILLFGFDMHSSGGEMHWHGRHPEPLRNAGEGIFERWIKHFEALSEEASNRRIEILNCTPGSALHAFRFASMDEAFSATDDERYGLVV